MGKRIVIMAGGTGGHVFPALAVAQYLREKDWDISWIGTRKGMESKVVSAENIEIDMLAVAGIRGKGVFSKIKNIFLLLKSCLQAMCILRNRKPDVVLGMGGYVAGPGGLMAKILSIPLVIHEQNRIPGTTNRLLVNRATRVLEAFPQSFEESANAIFTGNPLRKEFTQIPSSKSWDEQQERDLKILIVGGSQGAQVLNEVLPEAAKKMKQIELMHQTGEAQFQTVCDSYEKLPIQATAVAFIDDMSAAYQWADMIICRSGAMTVSEVAAAGMPAIFVPLPHAIDNHQVANANYLVDENAAVLLPQSEFNAQSLVNEVEKVKAAFKDMSKAARNKAKMDATELVAGICNEVASI